MPANGDGAAAARSPSIASAADHGLRIDRDEGARALAGRVVDAGEARVDQRAGAGSAGGEIVGQCIEGRCLDMRVLARSGLPLSYGAPRRADQSCKALVRASKLCGMAVARAGIRAMRRYGWTVDAGWSMSPSRPQHQGHAAQSPGGNDRYGRASARATETDTGNPAFLGWHRAPANCGCSAATPAPTCTSRRARSVRPVARARSIFKASGKGTLYSYVINHRPAPGLHRRPTPSPWWNWRKARG